MPNAHLPPKNVTKSPGALVRKVSPAALLALGTLSLSSAQAASPQKDTYIVQIGSTLTGNVGTNDGLNPAYPHTFSTASWNPPPAGFVLNADGSFTFTPVGGATHVQFPYQLAETQPSNVMQYTGWVDMWVNDANSAARPDAVTIHQDEVAFIPVLANDLVTPPLVYPSRIECPTVPANGTLGDTYGCSLVNGTIPYKPNAGISGTDSFIYALYVPDPASLPNTISSAAMVTVNVLPTARPTLSVPATPAPPSTSPRQENDAYGVAPGYQLQGNVEDNDPKFLAGESPQISSLSLSTAPTHAQNFVLYADGSFAYEPAPGFVGVDTFSYSGRYIGLDANNIQFWDNAVATAYITVPTRVVDDAANATAGQALSASVATNDQLHGMAGKRFIVTSQPTHGTLNLDPDTGSYTYVPDANTPDGTVDTFEYDLAQLDAGGTELGRYKQGLVRLTIAAQNVAPSPSPAPAVQPVPVLDALGLAGLSTLVAGGGLLAARRRKSKPKR